MSPRASSADRVLLRTAAGIPFSRAASTWSFMSAMSGLTTSGEPVTHEGRKLVAQGLAAAGGQRGENVTAPQDRLDDILLVGREKAKPKCLLQRL